MRINDTYASEALPPQAGKAGQAEAATPGAENKQAASRAAIQADQVHLSELSGRLLRMASAQPPERTSRLERLGLEVRAGRYQVDAVKVGRALIEEVLKGG